MAFVSLCQTASALDYTSNIVTFNNTVSRSVQDNRGYLRLFNRGDAEGAVEVNIYEPASGTLIGTYETDLIAPGAAIQLSIDEVVTSAVLPAERTADGEYNVELAGSADFYVQNVIWNAQAGALTNMSNCSGFRANGDMVVNNVHSSLISGNFPSYIRVYNSGSEAAGATLSITDSRDGTQVATFDTPAIAPRASYTVLMDSIEGDVAPGGGTTTTGAFQPDSSMYHYNVAVTNDFTGRLQHISRSVGFGIEADMTAKCDVDAETVWFVDNTAVATGTGRSEAPFATLAAAQNASGEDDIIFVFAGDGTSAGYDTGFVMKNGQQLIGEVMGLTISNNQIVQPGLTPQLSRQFQTQTAVAEVVKLAQDNTVSGFRIRSEGSNVSAGLLATLPEGSYTFSNLDISITGGVYYPSSESRGFGFAEINGAGSGIVFLHDNAWDLDISVSDSVISSNGHYGLFVRSGNSGTVSVDLANSSFDLNGSEGVWLYAENQATLSTEYSSFAGNGGTKDGWTEASKFHGAGLTVLADSGWVDLGGGMAESPGYNRVLANDIQKVGYSLKQGAEFVSSVDIVARNNYWGMSWGFEDLGEDGYPPFHDLLSGAQFDVQPWLIEDPQPDGIYYCGDGTFDGVNHRHTDGVSAYGTHGESGCTVWPYPT